MKQSEKRALASYPVVNTWSPYGPLPVDQNKLSREKYQEGYEQAEKDLIEKAVKWLSERTSAQQIKMFRKAMEGE